MISGTDFSVSQGRINRKWRSVITAVAMAALLVSFAVASKPASAQGLPTEITGTVVQGTSGSDVPAGLNVVLLVVDEPRQTIIANESTVIGTNGQFTFTDILSGPGLTYRIAADIGEYTPSVDLIPGESSFSDVELTIYDETESLDDVRISTYQMLIPSIDRAHRIIGVLGVITLVNSGDRVWIPDLQNPELTGLDLLRFNLPEGFSELSVETSLPPGDILPIPTGFAMTNPFPPGEFQIVITYIIEYDGDSLPFPLRLAYGSDLVRIMLPEGEGEVTGLGFGAAEGAIIEDTAYSVVDGQNYDRNSQLDVEFNSLPTPSLLEGTQNFFDGRGYIIVIAWIVGAVILGLLVYAFFFSKQRSSAPSDIVSEDFPEYEGLDRTEIVEKIAALDKQHDAGEIEETDYAARRAVLTQAALSSETTEEPPE